MKFRSLTFTILTWNNWQETITSHDKVTVFQEIIFNNIISSHSVAGTVCEGRLIREMCYYDYQLERRDEPGLDTGSWRHNSPWHRFSEVAEERGLTINVHIFITRPAHNDRFYIFQDHLGNFKIEEQMFVLHSDICHHHAFISAGKLENSFGSWNVKMKLA